jgi:diguanylate cyclase (GGDEF)-like protein
MEQSRILIIDDDPDLRKAMADILRAKGYETLTAADGEEGLALLLEQRVNVVLLDLGLPGLPGLEVLARIKADWPMTGVIILTGQATIDSAVAATNRGAFSYLVKPCQISELSIHIRRAIEKQQVEEAFAEHHIELERKNAELKTLHEVSEAINQTLDMDELVTLVLQVLVETKIFPFELRGGGVFLVEDGKLRLASFVNLSATVLKPCQELAPGQCFCGQALVTGKIIISRDIGATGLSPLCLPEAVRLGHIVIPLKAVNRVVGLLSLYTEQGTEVGEDLQQFLDSLGSLIGIAVNNSRHYEEIKTVSLHDPLTGLANRRFLEIQLEKCFGAAKRYQEKLSLVMLDIDHFKEYNDTHGHQAGDRLLTRLAEVLLREMRDSDYVFRYGGEEFLCMFPETGLATAGEAAERLRMAVEAETDVTISLGVATFTGDMPDKETLVRKADEALYRAKQEGRNRVEQSLG